jgi:PAS domain S-box-containing protein
MEGNVGDSADTVRELPRENSLPGGVASLASILCTDELLGRPTRPPDFERENRALVKLVSALADSPETILQTLADTILEITRCDSAGLSLLTRDGKTPDVCGHRFYWPAIAGMWTPHLGGGTPRDFGPCGDVLDQNRTLLFRHFERRYHYFLPVTPLVEECLLVPFYVAGQAVGTIWAIMHSERRQFDGEDDRVMASLGKFASSAYQAVTHIDDLRVQVAERERAEAEVRELARGLEAKVRRLVEANVVGIVMWNLEGAVTGANDAFLRMVQYDRDDVASGLVRWTDLTPAEWRADDERAVSELQATGVFQPFEKEYLRKDGSRVPVLLGGSLFDRSGTDGVAFVLELSEQKRTEEALDRARAQLMHVVRATSLGVLTASIAHELNQPLSGIITNANTCLRMLASDPPDVDGARETARRTIRDGNRASEVITRLRALFVKNESPTEMVDLNDATSEVIALSSSELQRNRVVIRSELADNLPTITGDRIQLQQVILNLLRNASDAMVGVDDRPRQLLIRTEQEDGTCVRVTVRDTGVGFDRQSMDKLFDPFYTTKNDGMGIGLSVSRSIVERHHGRLWAEPNDGPGATFSFSIPRDPATMTDAAPAMRQS